MAAGTVARMACLQLLFAAVNSEPIVGFVIGYNYTDLNGIHKARVNFNEDQFLRLYDCMRQHWRCRVHFNQSQSAFGRSNVIRISEERPFKTPSQYGVYCEYLSAGEMTCTRTPQIHVARENARRLVSRYCNNDTCECVYFKHIMEVIKGVKIAEPCSGIANKTHTMNSTERPFTSEASNNFHVGFVAGLSVSIGLVVVIIITSLVFLWKKKQFMRSRKVRNKQNVTMSCTTKVDNTTMSNLSSTESSSPSAGGRGLYERLSISTSTHTTGPDIVGADGNSPPVSNVYMNSAPQHYSEVVIAGPSYSDKASYSRLHEDASIRQNTYNTLCEFTENIK
ncbi:hypothetical protein BsWGS_25342 [Bradybaena similaris]